jgi:hypothetical protein
LERLFLRNAAGIGGGSAMFQKEPPNSIPKMANIFRVKIIDKSRVMIQ